MKYVAHRAIHYLFSPIGELMVILALAGVVAFSLAAGSPSLLSGPAGFIVLLAAGSLTLLQVALGMKRVLGGDNQAIDLLSVGDRSVSRYLEGAPTFVQYSHVTKVSLTKNIRSFTTDGDCNFTFHFLQPVMPETMVARPFGGTPRFDVVSCSERHLHIRLAEKTEVLKLAIFGETMPVIQNHPDDPAPSLGAFGRIAGSRLLPLAPPGRNLDEDRRAVGSAPQSFNRSSGLPARTP